MHDRWCQGLHGNIVGTDRLSEDASLKDPLPNAHIQHVKSSIIWESRTAYHT